VSRIARISLARRTTYRDTRGASMSFKKLGEPDQGGDAVKPASSYASTERGRRETVSLIFLTGRRARCLRNDSEKGLEEQHSTHPAVQYSRTPAYYVSYATTPAMDPSPPLRGLVECVYWWLCTSVAGTTHSVIRGP
jgi:hypothetical protein